MVVNIHTCSFPNLMPCLQCLEIAQALGGGDDNVKFAQLRRQHLLVFIVECLDPVR